MRALVRGLAPGRRLLLAALLATMCLTVVVLVAHAQPSHATSRASTATQARTHATQQLRASVANVEPGGGCSDPEPEECVEDPKTHCPVKGPLHPSGSQECVQIAGTVVNVKGHAPNGGCSNLEVIQVTIPAAGEQFEAAWYSELGLGTRWWQSPGEPSPIVNGAASYTIPPGQAAWSGAGGNGGPSVCEQGIPPKTFGVKAWALTSGKGSGGGSGGGKLSIKGPTHNAFHVHFNEVITGSASGAANEVISGEQLGWTPKCASTLVAEQSRSTWQQWPTGTGSVHGRFRLVARFLARNHLRHAICSYLVNRVTHHTYAYAAHYWSNA